MASFAGIVDKKTGDFEGQGWAFSVDAIATIIGSILGLSPVTTFVESGSGIQSGGKTGLTSIFTSIFFLLSIIFTPIFSSIPQWATGPALIVIGCLMCKDSITKIEWNDLSKAFPAFITIIIMPMTYSIAYGIIAGLFVSLLIYLCDLIRDACCSLIKKTKSSRT